MTPTDFAQALLARLRLPASENNVRSLVAVYAQEGGHENGASFNPLNTMLTTALNPSFPYPSVNFSTKKPGPGVQAYRNWKEGLEATAMTMEQKNMRPIFESLRSSAAPLTTVKVFGDSFWGWWDPKKGFPFKLPHPAADAIASSSSAFRSVADHVFSSGKGMLDTGEGVLKDLFAFRGTASKVGAAVVGVSVLTGIAVLGYALVKKAKRVET